jgi:hypothetical protein
VRLWGSAIAEPLVSGSGSSVARRAAAERAASSAGDGMRPAAPAAGDGGTGGRGGGGAEWPGGPGRNVGRGAAGGLAGPWS